MLKERLGGWVLLDAPEDFLGFRCSRSGLKRLNGDTQRGRRQVCWTGAVGVIEEWHAGTWMRCSFSTFFCWLVLT